MLKKCDFCENWYFESVISVKNEILKMWIFFKKNEFLKMWICKKNVSVKCDFCEKWVFENVNFVKNVSVKCDFCEKWNGNVNFVRNMIL